MLSMLQTNWLPFPLLVGLRLDRAGKGSFIPIAKLGVQVDVVAHEAVASRAKMTEIRHLWQ